MMFNKKLIDYDVYECEMKNWWTSLELNDYDVVWRWNENLMESLDLNDYDVLWCEMNADWQARMRKYLNV